MTHSLFRTVCLSVVSLALLTACQDDTTTVTGYVEADRIHVGLPAGGQITAVEVTRGQSLQPGQSLFRLDDRAEQARRNATAARLEQARAQRDDLLTGLRPNEIQALLAQRDQAAADARQAGAELARQRGLSRAEASARTLLDRAEADSARAQARIAELEARIAQAREGARSAAVNAAEAAIAAAEADLAATEWALSQRIATAPAAARVEDILFQPGETVAAGAPVVALIDPDRIMIRLYLGPEQISRIRPGQALPVRCGGCPSGMTAQVRFIAGEASYAPPVLYSRDNAAALVFRVDAAPQAVTGILHPGQPVQITLPGPDGG
ncbi:HlyD family secretion protein [Novispirillum itersonii]|uniref:HlyD family secretion protein n=1 Tax=Novispirillum itersonii TaxID=189 RepID=A0A7W9ZES9_NOVIT|nr:HlyD family efflux transporter periplasmic adaptor subunit [Novispirillum itersonii]MBB6210156.1 HlyD family secretion protein [Novispirillum itersonii]